MDIQSEYYLYYNMYSNFLVFKKKKIDTLLHR